MAVRAETETTGHKHVGNDQTPGDCVSSTTLPSSEKAEPEEDFDCSNKDGDQDQDDNNLCILDGLVSFDLCSVSVVIAGLGGQLVTRVSDLGPGLTKT